MESEADRMIFHILSRAEWDEAVCAGLYSPASLATDGFVHCSTVDQVATVANDIFSGKADLVLLCIEERQLRARISFEPAFGKSRDSGLFPHVYGPINVDAVSQVIGFNRSANGIFSLPHGLATK
jgi:uncharacterized protein (DUF952 family)